MTATYNPQADHARAAYRKMTDQLGHLGLDTAVPEGVRALAEKAVAQRQFLLATGQPEDHHRDDERIVGAQQPFQDDEQADGR